MLVVVGGTIPADDAEELKEQGVAAVFGPGATTGEIVDFLARPPSPSDADRAADAATWPDAAGARPRHAARSSRTLTSPASPSRAP